MAYSIVLDTETTGLDHKTDRLVEIAGLDIHSDNYFASICNPGCPIGVEALATHHIDEETARSYPSPAVTMANMLMHLDRPKLAIAHNAAFDRPFVKAIAPDWNPDWICTLKCSIMTWPDSPRHTNQVLRYYLGLKPALLAAFPELAPHRALYDIIVTREIFHTLYALNPLDRLLEWSNNPILLPKVTFGKHKGKAWSEVDRGYLRWCLTQEDMNEDVLFTARHWFDRR